MTRQIVGIAGRIDTRQDRGSGLARTGIGLSHARARRRQIRIVLGRQIHEGIQLVAAEITVPLLGRPPAGCALALSNAAGTSRGSGIAC